MSALPTRPLLLGVYHVVALDADRLQVCNAGRSVVLTGVALTKRAEPLLAALDGRTTLDDIQHRFPDVAPAVLEALAAKGMLTEAAEPKSSTETAAAMAATAVASQLPQDVVARRLVASTVLLAGCGAIGAGVAVLLAKAGVGRLMLIDNASVTPADVSACPVLPAAAVGASRAAATVGVCSAVAGGCYEAVEVATTDALASSDLAVLEHRHDQHDPQSLAERCLAVGTTYLLCSQDALTAVVGPLVRAGEAPCHHCAEIRRRSHVSHLAEHLAYLRHRAAAAPFPDAFLAAHSAIVAGVASAEVLRALAGASPDTDAVAAIIELANPSISWERVLAVPGCSACAEAQRIVARAPVRGMVG